MTTGANDDIISPEIDKVLQQCVNRIVTEERFITHEVEKTALSLKGEGYMAIPYTIDIKGRTQNCEKEIHLFVKIAIRSSLLDLTLSIHTAYQNECFFYKELSKVFKNLQDDAGIPEEERFKMIKGFGESSSDVIILENVSPLGFKTCKRMEVPNVKFMELAFEQIAKFHALGFVMQKKIPNYFEKKIKVLEHLIQLNDSLEAMSAPFLKITMKNLKPEIKKKAESFQSTFLTSFEQHVKDTNSIGTICHGDFRANNLLLKEEEGEFIEVIPIDYQVIHYGCPANDLLHLLYGCTDQKFRNAYKSHLIDLYYEHLGEFLKYFDIDVSEVYPRKEFDRAIKERADYGLMLALCYYAAYFAPVDDVPDISKDMSQLCFNLDPEIVKRIEEIVEECDEVKDDQI